RDRQDPAGDARRSSRPRGSVSEVYRRGHLDAALREEYVEVHSAEDFGERLHYLALGFYQFGRLISAVGEGHGIPYEAIIASGIHVEAHEGRWFRGSCRKHRPEFHFAAVAELWCLRTFSHCHVSRLRRRSARRQ